MRPGRLPLLASILVGVVGGCSSTALRTDGSTPPDLGIDNSNVDAGPCIMPLATVAATCPATYDAIDAFACGRCPDCSVSAGSCGDFLMFFEQAYFDTSLCYYDATTRQLVALVHSTDYPEYCGGTAYVYSAGVSVGACERLFFNPGLPPYVCPDGGAFDGAVPDLSPDSSGN